MKKVGMFVDNGLWEEWVEFEVDDEVYENMFNDVEEEDKGEV